MEEDADGPFLSIGVFSHNHEDFISESLASIDAASPTEVIITDDGSDDSTPTIITHSLEMLDRKGLSVRTILDPDNRGFVARLNQFLVDMNGMYFLLLSGDDRIRPGGIERVIRAARDHPEADIVFSRFVCVDPHGEALSVTPADKRYVDLGRRYTKPGRPISDLLRHGSFVSGGCTLVRSDFVRRHGIQFNPNLPNAEDYDFWLECAHAGALFCYVESPVHDYRLHPQSKYASAGSERLEAELDTIGRHRVRATLRLRIWGLAWGVQIWKGQYLKGPRASRVTLSDATRLLRSHPASIVLVSPLVVLEGIARRVRGWR